MTRARPTVCDNRQLSNMSRGRLDEGATISMKAAARKSNAWRVPKLCPRPYSASDGF